MAPIIKTPAATGDLAESIRLFAVLLEAEKHQIIVKLNNDSKSNENMLDC